MDGKSTEKKIKAGHSRGIALLFYPIMQVKVAKDRNAIFGMVRATMFIIFDGSKSKGWENLTNNRPKFSQYKQHPICHHYEMVGRNVDQEMMVDVG
eukprot:14467872-Ditylum_brightwellii.AAC.1